MEALVVQMGLEVMPAEDETALEAAKQEAVGLVFDGPATLSVSGQSYSDCSGMNCRC